MRIISLTLLFCCLFSLEELKAITKEDKIITVKNIVISGNKRTKESLVKRELLLQEGDSIKETNINNLLHQSKNNLINTGLFNFVTINIIEESFNVISVFILLTERWYIFPYPILEQANRNFSNFLHDKKWGRINYGLHLVDNNFRGRAEKLKFKIRLGYKQQIQLMYEIPYLGKKKQHSIFTEISFYRQHEIFYNVLYDKLLYVNSSDDFVQKYHTSILKYKYRRKYYTTHTFKVQYTKIKVLDTVIALNSKYLGENINKTQFFTLGYQFDIDKRDYKYYPLRGYNLQIEIQQKGFNFFDKKFLPNTVTNAEFFQYLQIRKNIFCGIGGNIQLANDNNVSFFTKNLLGYKNYLRAYQYNVFEGQNYLTTRAFFKYAIIPMKIKQIGDFERNQFTKLHYSLFANLFFDSGYVHFKNRMQYNKLPNKYQYSIGLGLDFVTYYDFILRLEYSINKYLKHGFFLNLGKAF